MPINWDTFNDDVNGAINDAVNETDEALASKVSSLTRLTDEEVKQLFPQTADLKKLAELMQIVKSAESRNTKVNQLTEKSEELAGVVLTLLSRFA